MSNHIIGKEIEKLPGELIAYIKAGRLHPVDEFLRPILPPTVTRTAERLKYLKEMLEKNQQLLTLEKGKIKALSKPAFRSHDLEVLQKSYTDSKTLILKEMKTLLDNIENKTAWSDYKLPDNPILAQKDLNLLLNSYFHKDEVRKIGFNVETPLPAQEEPDSMPPKASAPIEESAPAPQIEPQAENYFKRNGKHWAIKYKNEVADHIDHVDGLLYIAHLLEKPGKDISDQTLHQLAKGVALKETIDANEMIERNLSKGFKPQPIGTDKQRKICQAKYQELQGKFETASLEEQDEINEKMDKLVPFLNMKKRNFADPNDRKAQSNMKKRIDLAYDKLKEENMPELAMYLKGTIKTGDYGRRYVGPVTWKIEINK